VTSGIPVLFVLGSEDKFINFAQTQAYQKFFEGSKIQMVEGAGHMSTKDQPGRFNRIAEDFISNYKNTKNR
jgi:pimeloyl-ACP methyl ester carboxylesterase